MKDIENKQAKKESKNNIEFSKKKIILYGIIPFIILATLIAFLLSPYSEVFLNAGIALPNLTIEKIEFQEDFIIAHVRNTGQFDTVISQADINDRIHPAGVEPSKHLLRFESAKITIPFSWNIAEPYEIGITTSDGTRFSKIIEAAAPTPNPNYEQFAIFAIIGTYVGIIPILIGLLWYPFIKKLNQNKYNFFLSLTVGLLVFLGLDALLESNEIVVSNVSKIFNGQMLIIIGCIITFLVLIYISNRFTQRTQKSKSLIEGKNTDYNESVSSFSSMSTRQEQKDIIKPIALSLMIAISIGLHNFGEGLAIGSAILIGEVALSTFLIVGFTIHNTTEGLAIVAPLTKSGKITIRKLATLGLIAGGPTIIGAWIGGFLYHPIASVIFLAIGAGAIFQVAYQVYSWFSSYLGNKNTLTNGYIVSGFIVGIMIMYLTGLFI